ncbi:MAG TPA: hypothetical protein PLO13_03340 [Anaerolineaceae bacterium]|nr:hypothetical protein [Anaerolineaceae bacterium]
MPNPIRLTLALSNPTPTPSGEYEILAITSGLGNGWHFPPAVLQSSLPLWDGVHCFLDHALTQRSVRDIAGILINPSFDEDSQGIRAKLQPFGPGADLLASLASVLIPPQKDYHIGFSADLSFLGSNHTVKEIVKVHSVDLVVNPARGGKFCAVVGSAHPALGNHPLGNAGNMNFQPHISKSINKGELMTETPLPQPDTTQQEISLSEDTTPESKRAQPVLDHALREGEERQSKRECPQVTSRNALHEGVVPNREAEERPLNNALHNSGALQQELDRLSSLRRQLSSLTLDQILEASRLPRPSIDHIKSQFSGTDFSLDQLETAIAEHRKLLSALTASNAIAASPRVDQMTDETDRIQAAVEDLFGIPRDPARASLKAPKLTGIRELYLSLTGDTDLHGGYFPERVQLATTADFTGLVKNALNKIISNTWEELGRAGYDWWKYVSTQEHFATLHPITGTLVGTVGSLPTVAEGGAYTELPVGDSPETASFTKYGGYIPLTLELIDRDETRKLRAYTRELASAGMRNISSLVSAIFTANSGIGPTMADTGALFNATAVTTAGGHANLSTTALSSTSWDTVCANVYKQPMLIKNAATYYGTGPQMAVNPKFLLVPRAMQKLAREICEGSFVRESGYVYDNVLKGSAVPITVPEWTDANNWAAACDPLIAPAVFIGERFGLMPEIFVAGSELSPAVFTNDEHRLKVRHFLAVWVNDFRPLAKANVA